MASIAPDPDAGVGFLIGSIVRCKRLWFRQLLAPHRITPLQYSVLARLNERDGQALHELARRLFVDGSVLSRALGRMEREHLVMRVRSVSDRRVCQMHLTDRGREMIDTLLPELQKAERQMLEGLDERSVRTLKRLLNRVLVNVAVSEQPALLDGSSTEQR